MTTMEESKTTRKAGARRVPIEVKAAGAEEVLITGDFNRWVKEGVRLSHDGRGTLRTILQLPPGEYQYRLIVDGAWRDHPESPKRVPNPFGTENCVLIVT